MKICQKKGDRISVGKPVDIPEMTTGFRSMPSVLIRFDVLSSGKMFSTKLVKLDLIRLFYRRSLKFQKALEFAFRSDFAELGIKKPDLEAMESPLICWPPFWKDGRRSHQLMKRWQE